MEKILFVAQARSGSSRLPRKVLLPFYGGKTILQLLIEKLRTIPGTDLLIATTDNPHDDALAQMASDCGAPVYRGSENDVLARFIGAASQAGAQRIIRICSDNPFLDADSLRLLADTAIANPDADYISFDINGTPSIKTHYGFWAEYATVDALKRVAQLTDEQLYHEHVTNYIYAHPEAFNIKWIPGPGDLLKNLPIRLTIDTEADFKVAQEIYATLKAADKLKIADVVEYAAKHPQLLASMQNEINKNTK